MKLFNQSLTIAFSTVCISAISFSQTSYNKWSVEPSFGIHRAFNGYTNGYEKNLAGIFSSNLSGRYMINQQFGVSANFGFNRFSNDEKNHEFTSNELKMSVQGVFNIGQFANFNNWSSRFGLLAHGGIGLGFLANDKVALSGSEVDKMGNIMFGFTPQIRLSDRVAIVLDATLFANFAQQSAYDFKSRIGKSGMDSYYGQATVGVAIYLGKNKQHADWYKAVDPLKATVDSLKVSVTENTEKISNLEDRVTSTESEIEKLKADLEDDDNDGVANRYDVEPNTPAGVRVDTKGQEIKDLVPNSGKTLDAERGLFFTVQLGVYSREVPSETFKNLGPLETKTMPDMTIRYFTGIYHSQEEAAVKHKEAVKVGISDAFMTAYYKGERITLVEARTILSEKGPGILSNKR